MKKIYILCIMILLAGCSMGNKELGGYNNGINSKEVVEAKSADEEMKELDSNNHLEEESELSPLLQPTYLDESKYEGDELGIVKALNQYMRAVYEKDYDALNAVMPKGTEKMTGEFKKYYISFDRLDFSVKPDPTPPEGTKGVVVNFKTKIYDHKEKMEEDKQLFLFRLEDGQWKFVATADWW
ncbi:hypothetical protein [Paenibacillus sp. NPDC058174]|uniref:hypothetical protein n=1 Tax=Paenibacillus sp. NPDC058174 TaxID=3346366 RepID=UPI0036DB0FA5